MEQKIRIGAVSYLNTKPMVTGLEKMEEIDLQIDYPSRIAKMLLNGIIDIGLVPVAIIPLLKEAHIITDFGIACDGPVTSVCIYSEVPVEKIDKILLDYQSRTSVQLLKILLKEYWEIEPALEETDMNYEKNIKGTTAGLVIGDRALELNKKFNFIYDLGEIWKKHTGLPFVFAAWVSNRKLDNQFEQKFNSIISNNIKAYFQSSSFQLLEPIQKTYLQKNIKYNLESDCRLALNLFLSKIS